MNLAELRETDYSQWLVEVAKQIHDLKPEDLDSIAEDLLEMSNSEKTAVESHLGNFLLHHLKWEHQPEKRTQSWATTIYNSQNQLQRLTRKSAVLRNHANQSIESEHTTALKQASRETKKPKTDFPLRSPFQNLEEILNYDPEPDQPNL